jgi:hypothetical protein
VKDRSTNSTHDEGPRDEVIPMFQQNFAKEFQELCCKNPTIMDILRGGRWFEPKKVRHEKVYDW